MMRYISSFLLLSSISIGLLSCVTTSYFVRTNPDLTIKEHRLAEERKECGSLFRQAEWFLGSKMVTDDGWGSVTSRKEWSGFAYCVAYQGEDTGAHCGSACSDGCSRNAERDSDGSYWGNSYSKCVAQCTNSCITTAGTPGELYCPDTVAYCAEKRKAKAKVRPH